MNKAWVTAVCVGILFTGCNKSKPPVSAANPSDPVEVKLQEVAGAAASNCGHLKSQDAAQLDAAAKCATEAAKSKKPFFVAYEMPGMTIAVAGNPDGKLFTLQSQGATAGNASALTSEACPSELRVAPSGRVTCFAPGTFGMGMDANHGGGMGMPPATGASPHGAGGALPAGHPSVKPKP